MLLLKTKYNFKLSERFLLPILYKPALNSYISVRDRDVLNAAPKERIRSTFRRGSRNHSSELEEPTPRTDSSESSTTEDFKRREAQERNRYSAMRSRNRKREVFDRMKKENKHLSMENNILRKVRHYLIAKIISISFHHKKISIEVCVE